MKEFEEKFAQVKIEDLKKTYDEECGDVQRVLRKMYPKELNLMYGIARDVTLEITLSWFEHMETYYPQLHHEGKRIGYIDKNGLALDGNDYYHKESSSENWRIFKRE